MLPPAIVSTIAAAAGALIGSRPQTVVFAVIGMSFAIAYLLRRGEK